MAGIHRVCSYMSRFECVAGGRDALFQAMEELKLQESMVLVGKRSDSAKPTEQRW